MVVVTLVHPAAPPRISVSGPLLKLRSDEHLLAAFRDGNEEAFSVIFDRYRSRLLRYTSRMLGGSAAEAEDVLQDVFVRAYRSLAVDERELPLKAWLYRVAHNRCVDHLRRPVTDDAAVYQVNRPMDVDPHAQTEQRETLRRLVHDVRELPEQQRAALLLRELEGLSYADVAATMDVTVPAVKSLLVRARGGLLDAQEAQDTACADVHASLDDARSRGVRMTGLARRHLLTCGDCRRYHAHLRDYDRAVAAIDGGPGPIAALAKLLGCGSAGGGAAAATGGTTVVGTGGLGVLTAAGVKAIAVLATAAVVTGGAVEASRLDREPAGPAKAATATAASAAPVAAPLRLVRKLQEATRRSIAEQEHAVHAMMLAAVPAPAAPVTEADAGDEGSPGTEVVQTGGVTAPATLADDPETDTTKTTTTSTSTSTSTSTTSTSTATPPAPTTTTPVPVTAGAGAPPPPVITTATPPAAR